MTLKWPLAMLLQIGKLQFVTSLIFIYFLVTDVKNKLMLRTATNKKVRPLFRKSNVKKSVSFVVEIEDFGENVGRRHTAP